MPSWLNIKVSVDWDEFEDDCLIDYVNINATEKDDAGNYCFTPEEAAIQAEKDAKIHTKIMRATQRRKGK